MIDDPTTIVGEIWSQLGSVGHPGHNINDRNRSEGGEEEPANLCGRMGNRSSPKTSLISPFRTLGGFLRGHCLSISSLAMTPHRALPQELVDKVVDELGDAYRDLDRKKRRRTAGRALRACTLVSKNWTGRSRAHLFREITIRADEDDLFLTPPQSLIPHIKRLKIWMRNEYYRTFLPRDLLKQFHRAPMTYLGISEGVLATAARGCIAQCVVALSATLQTVEFRSCSLTLHLILDILSAHPGLKRLHLTSCSLTPAKSGRSVVPSPGMRSEMPDLELGVFMHPLEGGHDRTVATAAQIPNQFGRLDLDYVHCQDATNATNALIKASAGSLSFLQVHVISSTSKIPKRRDDAANCYQPVQQLGFYGRGVNRCSVWETVSTCPN